MRSVHSCASAFWHEECVKKHKTPAVFTGDLGAATRLKHTRRCVFHSTVRTTFELQEEEKQNVVCLVGVNPLAFVRHAAVCGCSFRSSC